MDLLIVAVAVVLALLMLYYVWSTVLVGQAVSGSRPGELPPPGAKGMTPRHTSYMSWYLKDCKRSYEDNVFPEGTKTLELDASIYPPNASMHLAADICRDQEHCAAVVATRGPDGSVTWTPCAEQNYPSPEEVASGMPLQPAYLVSKASARRSMLGMTQHLPTGPWTSRNNPLYRMTPRKAAALLPK